jgi:hypothetical protein
MVREHRVGRQVNLTVEGLNLANELAAIQTKSTFANSALAACEGRFYSGNCGFNCHPPNASPKLGAAGREKTVKKKLLQETSLLF